MIVDISLYQTGLDTDALPDTVNGIIIKATQGLHEDPEFRTFTDQVRANPRWKYIGYYHFLSEGGVQREAAHFLATINSLGGLRPREFVVLDYETNGYTGYRPPMSDAVQWMQTVTAALPGRVAWYTFQSMASPARQSGEFPWPLWLADPNQSGPQWAQTLNAFLLQYGQQTLPMVPGSGNIDVSEIVDISVLDALCYPSGNSSPLGHDMDINETAAAFGLEVRNGQIGAIAADGNFYPIGKMPYFVHGELTRPDLLQKRLVDELLTRMPRAGVTPLTFDQVSEAVKVALKAQAAIMAAS